MAAPTAFAATPASAVATASARRFPAPLFRGRALSPLPHLVPPQPPPYSPSKKVVLSVPRRLQFCLIRASRSEDTSNSLEGEDTFTDLKEKWDSIEDKPSLLILGTGAIATVWLSSVMVNAINSLPVLPSVMEAVGLGYTGWFIYRYLLFKSSRKELAGEIDSFKKKITGSE